MSCFSASWIHIKLNIKLDIAGKKSLFKYLYCCISRRTIGGKRIYLVQIYIIYAKLNFKFNFNIFMGLKFNSNSKEKKHIFGKTF